MAHLYRLIVFALFLLPAFPAFSQVQTIAATSSNKQAVLMWGANSKVWDTPQLACQEYARYRGATLYDTVKIDDYSYKCMMSGGGLPYPGHWDTTGVISSCVANGGTAGGACAVTYTCPSGYWGPNAQNQCQRELCYDGTYKQPGTCPARNDCTELATLKTAAGEYSGVGSVGTYRVCDTAGVSSSGDPSLPGCVVSISADFAVTVGGVKQWSGLGSFTGAKCSPDPAAPVASDGQPAPPTSPTQGEPSTCPPGKVSGTVNGTTVCVDPGTSTPTEKKGTTTSTTTNPDGSTTQTTNNTTTTCTGAGSCTTTTTITTTNTPAGGGTPTTSTSSNSTTCSTSQPGCGEEEEDERSSFSGACGAAFVCDGDAIMCAVAQEQHKRNCSLFVDSSPESSLYDAEKGKTGPQYTNQNVPLGPSSFSQTNALGVTAQCIQDKVITVAGNTITLPFSQICSTLQHLGTVLLFISFLTAYRIVSRG